jgi:inner membrane protein
MPTIFSHALFAVILGKAAIKKSVTFWFWFLAALCAMIPDADVFLRVFGVERGGMFSHRGFTHSIVFAVLFGAFVAFLVHKFLPTGISFIKLFAFFALVVVSHPILDMLTDGGPGVALFAPFSSERFFLPFRPVEVSPIGIRFFGSRGIEVILSEIVWIWLPAFTVFLIARSARKFLKNK